MAMQKRPVRVHVVPGTINAKVERAFLADLRTYSEDVRPRFVLDCSHVYDMSLGAIKLLVCCLEEAMKCNGDVRLAGLQPGAEQALSKAGVSRLFETFSTAEIAIQSFQRRFSAMAPFDVASVGDKRVAGQAA